MRFFLVLLAVIATNVSYSETLTIATTEFTPPFVMPGDKPHQFYGFSIDIMSEVCKRIGAACQYNPVDFKDIFAKVISGQADLGLGNIGITKERDKFLAFSLPYLSSQLQFITLANSPITSLEKLRGKRVGTEEGTIFSGYVKRNFGGSVKLFTYISTSDILSALSSGKIDAAILDKHTAQYWFDNNSGVFQLVGPSAPIGFGIAIVANKNNGLLVTRINHALLEMEADNTYLKIYNDYF